MNSENSVLPCLLLVDGDALEGLLDDPAAVHLQGELLDVGAELEEELRIVERDKVLFI